MTITPPAASSPAAQQPVRVVQEGETRYTLLGTAHVSRASADEVERLIKSGDYDAVAVELCQSRHAALTQPERWAEMDLFQVIREGKAVMVAASLALSAFQQRLADQLGVRPGEEMRRATEAAGARELPLLLIDREIGVTLKRVYRSVPWWQRMTLVAGLLGSVISRESVSEAEIEKLKEGDVLEATFAEFAENAESIYIPLIAERDRYMAARLREETAKRMGQETATPYQNVLVVIGAGHLKGLAGHLEEPAQEDPARTRERLERVPPSPAWLRALPWLIALLVLLGFAVGFSRSPELGLRLLGDWFLINGGLAALGALLATAHPLTILGVFIAAPFTSLNPLIGAGFVAAGIELWLRRPRVGDFKRLRQDVTEARGWWRNRVARTLLVFVLATLGSALGTYLGGFRIVERLINV
ncbi:MAG: TraB/GumN family protein [Deinococcota bacterium]|nr:TraB/GumN family protein [Deinococcota bacterium]